MIARGRACRRWWRNVLSSPKCSQAYVVCRDSRVHDSDARQIGWGNPGDVLSKSLGTSHRSGGATEFGVERRVDGLNRKERPGKICERVPQKLSPKPLSSRKIAPNPLKRLAVLTSRRTSVLL